MTVALPDGFDQVRILNHITWKKVTEFDHPATINNTKAVSTLSNE